MTLRERVFQPIILTFALTFFSAHVFGQSTIVSDDFRTGALNTSLWTFINPGVPSSISFTGVGTQDARLNIAVPAGSAHDPWPGNNFPPRIMQSCNNTDFEVEVKFESPMTTQYQIEGIIVQQDNNNLLRFDFVKDASNTRIFAASFVNGNPTVRRDQSIAPAAVLYLRVKRQGNQWTESYSYNGTSWTNAVSFSHTLAVSSVGPYAGNAGTNPAFTGLVDYFFNTASPIVPEDPTAPPTPPTITTQPTSQTVLESESATFSVAASGSLPLSYQWQKNNANIGGATSASYTTPATTFADSGATFRCIVTNSAGSATSNAAMLHVNRTAPSITQQPLSQNILVGQTATFSIAAIGSPPLAFQWQKNGAAIVGATNSSYTTPTAVSADNGSMFRCVVANALGSATSNAALLSVSAAPTSVVSDDFNSATLNTSLWTFINPRNDASINITGAGTTDALLNIAVPAGTSHDVWSSGNFAPRVMQTIPNGDFELEVKFQSPMTAGYQIQGVIVHQDADDFLRFDFTSDFSNVRVFSASFASGAPSVRYDQNVAAGGVLFMRVKRLGNQWTQSYSFNGTTWTNAASFTRALTVNSVGPFAGNAGSPAPAFTARVDYFFNTAAPLVPEDGDGTPPIIDNIIVTPSTNSATIAWTTNERATSIVDYGLTSAYELGTSTDTTRVLSHNVLMNGLLPGRTYHFKITSRDSTGNSTSTTDSTFVTTGVGVSITQQPADRVAAVGQTATFTIRAVGTQPLFYSWQKNDTTIAGATDTIYTTPPTTLADSGATYRCIVSNAIGSDTSARAMLHVAVPPSVTSEPASQFVLEGDSATVTVVAIGSTPLSYRWQKNLADISGATNSSFTTSALGAADSGSTYRCIVTNIVGADTSVAAIVSVNVPATIIVQPTDHSVAVGQTAVFAVRARGTSPLSYQWQRNDTSIVDATDSSYTTPTTSMADSGAAFRCIVTNPFRADTSLSVILHVASSPFVIVQPVSDTVLVGETATFSITTTGTAPLSYQWQRNGQALAGATNATYTTSPAIFSDDGAPYRCVVSNPFGSDTSATATLTVHAAPTITTEPASVVAAAGQTATFHVVAIGTRPFSYEWLKNDTSVVGATDSVYTTPPVVAADSGSVYRCIVRNAFGADTSAMAVLRVASVPFITVEPTNQIVMEGDSATFAIIAEGVPPLSFLWFRNGLPDSMATTSSYTVHNVTLADNGSTVRCIVANIAGSDTSSVAQLIVNAQPAITTEPTTRTVAVGTTATFNVRARGSLPMSYQWLKNNLAIVGANDSIYTTPIVLLADSGATLRCVVTNSFGVDTSVVALLRVLIPPTITSEPANQTVFVGQPASFNVFASGSDTLTYQWFRDGVLINGASNRIHTLTTVLLTDSGATFRCEVRNGVGADTSSGAQLFVLPLPARIVSDDFSSPVLNPALWKFVNPGQPSTFSLTGTGTNNALLTMAIEAGVNHDVWSGGNFAPRLMQSAPNENFEVEVKFESQEQSAYQLQGIIVEQDSANYIRFDVYHDGGSPRAFAATFVAGNPSVRYDQAISSFAPLYLRVKRQGNQWTQSYSANGTAWTNAASFTHALVVRSIGPFFGNAGFPASTAPAFVGLLDYFFNTALPIVPEDSIRIPLAPTIVTQPANRLVLQGRTATFVVGVSGSPPLTYQWQKNGVNIAGATSAVYTTPATTFADSGSLMRCIISNTAGTATSNAAVLSVRTTLVGTMTFVNHIVDENSPRHAHCKTVGDIDGDGYDDVIAASGAGYNDGVYWYKYPTWSKYRIHEGSFSTDMQAADLDGDGDLDITIPKGTDLGRSVWWYENPLPSGNPANGPWVEHFLGTTLAHDVEVGDINADGKPDIVVRYDGATMFLSDSATTTWQMVVIAGRWSEGIALGDLDSDGDLDIGMNGLWARNPLPTGNPAIPAQWTYYTFDNTWEHHAPVHAVDLNDDGRTDLLIGAGEHTEVKRLVLYEQPSSISGTWTKRTIDTTVHDMHTIKTADMNNDGLLDIIIAEMHLSDDPDEIVVFVNDGNGGWVKTTVDVGGGHNLRVFDLGKDGDLDIMCSNTGEATDGSPIEVWENLLTQSTIPLNVWERHVVDSSRQGQALFITAGDLDNDRKLDLVTGGSWYKNPGAMHQPWIKDSIGAPMNNMVLVHDFDLDGRLDVFGSRASGLDSNANFAWAQNQGNGNFTIRTNIQTGQGDYVQGAAVRRFGIDTQYEVALSWNNQLSGVQMLSVPENPTTSTWSRRQISSSSQHGALSAKDVEPDRAVDLLMGTNWLQNNGAGYAVNQLNSAGALQPSRNHFADINGDGKLDAVVSFDAGNLAGKVAWYEQHASPIGVWTEHVISTSVYGPTSLDVTDMDRDGDFDVVVGERNSANPDSARLLIFENQSGSGTAWVSHVVFVGDEHYHGAQVFDLDGDGDGDIISTGLNSSNVLVYENKAIDSSGTRPVVTVTTKSNAQQQSLSNESLPKEHALYQNYPNPLNPTTTIRYDLPTDGKVVLQLFNILGQEVATLVNEEQKAGRYTLRFDASRYASGVYFYRMQSVGFVQTRKMLVTK